jgi:hypothetical protein
MPHTSNRSDTPKSRTSTSPYSLRISWDPGAGNPLAIYSVVVDGRVLVEDGRGEESPMSFPLSVPAAENRFKVKWAIAPDTEGTKIRVAIDIRNNVTNNEVPVACKSEMVRVDPPWADETTVNAP